MPAVVVDSSVLISLAAGEQFDVLREFYAPIYVPPAVWDEVTSVQRPFGATEARWARQAGWLILRAPARLDRVRSLAMSLQPGETEALALALELPDALLLIDDAQGRRAASALGLAYTGTLGVLLRAKAEGRLPALRPVLELLQQRTTFWLSAAVRQAVLQQAGEGR